MPSPLFVNSQVCIQAPRQVNVMRTNVEMPFWVLTSCGSSARSFFHFPSHVLYFSPQSISRLQFFICIYIMFLIFIIKNPNCTDSLCVKNHYPIYPLLSALWMQKLVWLSEEFRRFSELEVTILKNFLLGVTIQDGGNKERSDAN